MKKIIKKVESFKEWGGIKKDVICLIVSAVALILSIFDVFTFVNPAWIAIILCGVPIILDAFTGLVTAFDIKADVLVSLALIAAVSIGEDFAAGEVAFIMQLGALLEDLTVAKAKAGIEKLVKLTPQTARKIINGKATIISADSVKTGDVLRVLPGETIPVDGVIISGQTSVNQAVMTGESLPVDKEEGDDVSSGTVNQFGAFDMRAEKTGEDSSVQRMIRLVQSADASNAKIVSLADRWATWIVVAALTASVLAWIFTGEIIRSVTVLVVFCPCALVLATPTAIVAAIGNATKHGFLVREGGALERLAKVNKAAFDKTGTLTYGKPEVTEVVSVSSYSKEDIFCYAATAESLSEHPLGKAIVRSYGKETKKAENFKMIPGEGVLCIADGKEIKAGKLKLIKNLNTEKSQDAAQKAEKYENGGSTVIYVAIDGELSGFLVLSDTVREDSAKTINELKKIGVTPVLLTGDNQNSAEKTAKAVGISEVYAGCLPEDKLNYIDKCQKEKSAVCMIGDGINDAPALKKAYVGIAMGGVGSDIAVDAADIALVNDEIKKLPYIISLSKKMMKTVKFNMIFSMGLNFLAITLAVSGKLNPVIGALVHNAGSVFVIVNSALLLAEKNR